MTDAAIERVEPVVHSHITDVLPEDHPKAYPEETDGLFCECCGEMVHAINNECMQTWIEWAGHVCCGKCFGYVLIESKGVLDEAELERKFVVARLSVTIDPAGKEPLA